MTSYPSTVGVIGLSSTCWLPAGSDMERGQLEYSTEGSSVPFTLARVTGLWRGGGVRLRPPLSEQQDWCWEPNPLHPLPWSSSETRVREDWELVETLPSDEARCGRLSLLLPPDKALSMGTGTGTKGDAIDLSCVLLLLCFNSVMWGWSRQCEGLTLKTLQKSGNNKDDVIIY